jgi:hypothetical protein
MRKKLLVLCLLAAHGSLAHAAATNVAPFADHMDELMTVPNAVDSNQDGELSISEVLAAPEQLKKLDKNHDGKLDFNEIGAYEPVLPLVRGHKITNLVDANGDVIISSEEIANASKSLINLDKDGDWHISAGELAMNGNIKNPAIFGLRKMTPDDWKVFRGYTTEMEGLILPGKDSREYEGYTLIHDAGDSNLIQRSDITYLLDKNGKKVHEWKNHGYSPEATVAYLLPNGKLLRTYSKHNWIKDKDFPVGAHSTIQLVDWDGEAVWEFSMSEPRKYSFHHDVEYLPNGNILAIRYTGFTREEAMSMGWDPALGEKASHDIEKDGPGFVWMSSVLELKPNLEDGSTEIVWQWNSYDHLVQDKYPDKQNFGDVTDPSKIHINYLDLDKDIPFNSGQFFHINSVDYNPERDMIMLSSPTYGEVWFVDHSTTMEEVKGDSGGQYNKGGDLLYRWGNDETFGQDIRDNSTLYWQHDAHWIEDGLPGAGNILIYNNGNRRTLDGKYMPQGRSFGLGFSYSNILEVSIPMADEGDFDRTKSPEIVWSWENENKGDYYSPFMSGAQRLPNGNTIFTSAFNKYITEVTPEGEKVLDYSLPGWGRLYRVYKYAPSYSGIGFDKD